MRKAAYNVLVKGTDQLAKNGCPLHMPLPGSASWPWAVRSLQQLQPLEGKTGLWKYDPRMHVHSYVG